MPEPAPAPIEFDPPAAYVFEPELTGPPPRPLPDSLENGPYARRTRRSITRWFAFGLFCLVLGYVPGIATLAYYFLPFDHLKLIGIVSAGIAIVSAIHYHMRFGPFRHVQSGEALVVRIASLRMVPLPMLHAHAHAHEATVLYRHPQTGAIARATVKSNPFPVVRADEHVPPFKVGDYATAVYFPRRRAEKSLQLYAFLDLSPDVNTQSVPLEETSRRSAIALLWIAAAAVIILAGLYSVKRYSPIDSDDERIVMLACGGALAGLALFYWLVYRRQKRPPTPRHTLIVGSAVALLAGFLGVAAAFRTNAWLDHSPAESKPATIVGYWETTYEYVVRIYEIYYVMADSPQTYSFLTTPGHIGQFGDRRAVVAIRRGAFGWAWVESVDPVAQRPGVAAE